MQKKPARKKPATSFVTAEMRRRAEAQLRNQQRKQRRKAGRRKSLADTQRLLHDLQVHEVELEMQNEELQATRNRIEALLQKYAELYDLAPIGYFSLDEQGRILEVNLTGAALLGVERVRLVNRSLARFVGPPGRPIFLSFLEQIFSGPRSRLCEATLVKADGTTFWASFHGTSTSTGSGARKWCRVAVSDITTRKQAEQALQAAQHELERRVEERTAELQRNCVRLAHEIEERKRAEEGMESELRFEAMLAHISTRFVNLPPGEVDHEIMDAQRRIFELLELDVSGFWQWSAEASGFFRLTHYSRPGEGSQIPERMNSQDYFPWYQQQVLADRTIAVRSMTELPPEAARDRETFRQFGFKSNLTIPLSVGGEPPIGALGFTTRAEREWPDALVKRLQLVAEIFANALARKRADQALRESEERLSSIYNTVGDAMFRLEVEAEGQYRFVSINRSFCRVTGLSQEQVVGKSVAEVIPQPSLTIVLDKYRQAIETKTIVCWEEVSDYPSGRLTGDVSVTPIFEDNGRCTHLVGSVHDITERKRAEEALKESEEMLRSTFVSTPDSITVVDLNGRIKHCNQSAAHIHGFSSAEQLLGMNVSELVAREDHQRMEEARKQVMIHGIAKDVPFVGLKGSGGKFAGELSFSVLKDGSGRPIGFVGITRDVTERKRTEDALRASEIKYRKVVEMTGTGYLIIDLQGRVLDANQEYVRISGHGELREIIGRSVIEWTAERAKQQNAEAVAQCAKDGFIRNFVTEYTDGSGQSIFVEVNATVEREGESARIVSLCRDITERKQAEAEVRRQRAELAHVARVSTMGELAASVAHELNQPLGAILANAEAAELFLQRGPLGLDDVRAILADIRKDDERAGEVIRRMRSLLRKKEMERLPIQINSLVEDVLQLVSGDAALRGIPLSADLGPFLPKISGDHIHLQQVLLNLIINGMDAMAEQPRERRRLSVRTRLRAGGTVELAVIDSGHGIEPDKLPRIFDPFYTSKASGMGMGLSIARTIVEAHHGRIWAENNATGGTVLSIALPAVIEGKEP